MHKRLGKTLHIMLLLTTTALFTGCGGALISQEKEISLGQEAAPGLETEFGGRVANSQLQNYVQMVGRKLAAQAERDLPFDYAVVASEVPNAFALPGGKIYVTAGLMREMKNERQLAAVLAHETVHADAGHSAAQMEQAMGIEIFAEVIGAVGGEYGGAAGGATKIVGAMVGLRYSRSHEYESDQIGVTYLAPAGYNPWGMVELLTVLLEMKESEGGSFSEMFQTHPLTSNRIEEVQAIVERDYPNYSADTPDPRAAKFLQMRRVLIQTVGN
jgi:beta-barrel assembly-enhancing protease